MPKLVCTVIFAVCILSGCDQKTESPKAVFATDFSDAALIDPIVERVVSLGSRFELEVLEKDRQMQTALSDGKPAFFVALMDGGDLVVVVNNLGPAHSLRVFFFDNRNLEADEMRMLERSLIEDLNSLGLDLQPTGE